MKHVYRHYSKRPKRRRRHYRRSSDQYSTIVQRLMLAGGAIGIIYGQAEMLGEPWRHVLAVGFTIVLVAVAIWMKVT